MRPDPWQPVRRVSEILVGNVGVVPPSQSLDGAVLGFQEAEQTAVRAVAQDVAARP